MSVQTLMKSTMVTVALAAVTISASFVLARASGDDPSRRHVVAIESFEFGPAKLTIRQGDTVEWVNRDFVPHTATRTGKSWSTGKLVKKQSASIEFSTPGTISYFCRYHPNMRGEIIVTAK